MTAEPCRFTADKETRGIAVIEAAGGGKTIAIRTVLQSTSALQKNPETGLPRSLEIQTPSPATHKSVGLAILEATGMSGVSSSARAWEIWSAVRNRLGQMGITVLWLDEAQDLVMAQSANETETTLRTIKTLMQGENVVIPILSGTRRLGEMPSFDPQVSRRFTKIAPSDLDHSSDQDNIFGMIDAYCNEAGISARLPEDLAVRLMTGSRYRFGRAIETIVNAIECAILDGEVFLTVDHFAEAWAMQEGCDPGSNIFFAPDWMSIPLDAEAEEYEQARSKRQKKKIERG
ncbi:TniB family NTP-binding protein [Roseovarius atlanticus]|uniref:TniB family NTP-binding protein n=1 Tax=Roseovarius atlanticus TaxID=1641875 RepID=UPI001364BA63|nr:TniB family NTP-binding protein [Roseovarius atlanticus]